MRLINWFIEMTSYIRQCWVVKKGQINIDWVVEPA